jgi:hypothetical protein
MIALPLNDENVPEGQYKHVDAITAPAKQECVVTFKTTP